MALKKLNDQIILVLLSYLDSNTISNTKYNYELLRNGFLSGDINCVAYSGNECSAACTLKLNDFSNLELIRLLLNIRSKIPLAYDGSHYSISMILFDLDEVFVENFHSQETLNCLVNNCDFRNNHMRGEGMRAALNGNLELVIKFFNREKFARGTIGWNPFSELEWAIIGGSKDVLDFLIFNEKSDNMHMHDFEDSIIEFAISYGSSETLDYLLSKFCKYKRFNWYFDHYNLAVAFFSDNPDINEKAMILLKYGINMQSFTPYRNFSLSMNSKNPIIKLIANTPHLGQLEQELNKIKARKSGEFNEQDVHNAAKKVANQYHFVKAKLFALGAVALGFICYQILKETNLNVNNLNISTANAIHG